MYIYIYIYILSVYLSTFPPLVEMGHSISVDSPSPGINEAQEFWRTAKALALLIRIEWCCRSSRFLRLDGPGTARQDQRNHDTQRVFFPVLYQSVSTRGSWLRAGGRLASVPQAFVSLCSKAFPLFPLRKRAEERRICWEWPPFKNVNEILTREKLHSSKSNTDYFIKEKIGL